MVVGGWGLQSHFHVQAINCVEVVLRCVVVRVVTIKSHTDSKSKKVEQMMGDQEKIKLSANFFLILLLIIPLQGNCGLSVGVSACVC